MATYYVLSSYGYDGADGLSVETGWATIDYAASQVAAGDEVRLVVIDDGDVFDSEPATGIAFATNGADSSPIVWNGANAAGEVDGTIAVINCANLNASTSGITVSGNVQIFRYITIEEVPSGDGWSSSATGCLWHYCTSRYNGLAGFDVDGTHDSFIECVAHGNSGDGFNAAALADDFYGCVAYNNTLNGFKTNVIGFLTNCISYNNSEAGFVDPAYMVNCVAYNNTDNGITMSKSGVFGAVINCISTENGGYGIDEGSGDVPNHFLNNAMFGNTSGGFRTNPPPHGITSGTVTLTADPFIDSANGNFNLNNNQFGGLLCKNAGLPAASQADVNLDWTNFLDLGASQTALRIRFAL